MHQLDTVTNTDLRPNQYQVNLGLIISPGAELHGAVLIVEGEVGDVHGAGGFENGWRNPGDGAIELQQSLSLILHQEITYSAVWDTRVYVCVCIIKQKRFACQRRHEEI